MRLKQTETQIYYTCPIRISGLLTCYNTEESVWRISHGLSLSSFMSFHDAMDCSPPGSSVHGISQARIMEWVAFSKRFFPTQGSNPLSCVSCHEGGFLTAEPPLWLTLSLSYSENETYHVCLFHWPGLVTLFHSMGLLKGCWDL